MLRNNNQPAVKKLSDRSLRQNRTRNLFVVLAIILTTFMFTTVFSIGYSLAKNMNVMMLRQQGTKASITLKSPSAEQIKQAEQADDLNAAGIRVPVAAASDISGEENFQLAYYDRTEFEKNLSPALGDIKGRYPKKKEELMLSERGLDALHIKEPREGMDITLQSGKEKLRFTLSGYFKDYSRLSGTILGLVSEKYMESRGLSAEKDGVLCLSAKMGRQAELLSELDRLVELRKGQKLESIYDIQDENNDTVVTMSVIVVMIGLVIMFSGYLLIYNVMYISVTRDIRFYGMLKTIGTSPSQIKQMVKMQSRRLSVLGIPIGILLGTIVSYILLPTALLIYSGEKDAAMPGDMSFSPLIYGGTIIFALITVAVSCRKPAKLAGRVSVVEAMKYQGKQVKTKSKNTTSGGKLYKMAFRNVFRQKKRAVLVLASLFMGTLAFLMVDTFLGCMRLDHYVEKYLPYDFSFYFHMKEEGEEAERDYEREIKKLAADIEGLDGIKYCSASRSLDVTLKFDEEVFAPFFENTYKQKEEIEKAIKFYKNATAEEDIYSAPTVAVGSDMIKKYNETAGHKMDIERFEKGEICLVGFVNNDEQAKYMQGKKITLIDSATGREKELEIGACPLRTESRGLEVGYYWDMGGAPSCILISDRAAEFCTNFHYDSIIADSEKTEEPQVRREIEGMIANNPYILEENIKSKRSAEFNSAMSAMNILGGGISAVLIFIGVINFINVMLTGVYTRRMELAVLESVGMTKKQVKKMLCLEGLYYGLLSILLIMTLGNVMITVIGNLAEQVADYAVFYYPAMPVLGLCTAILGICIAVPVLVYRTLSKESVTERLRSGE